MTHSLHEVIAQYIIHADDDSEISRSMNETALRAFGCSVFQHEAQYSIRSDSMMLKTIGYIVREIAPEMLVKHARLSELE